MNFTHKQFSLFIHLIIAFVFLSAILEPYLPKQIYNFLDKNRNNIFGIYYVYLAYEIYLSINIENTSVPGSFE